MRPDELEMLERMWFPVARVDDLDAGPFGAELLGRRLVVFRDAERSCVGLDRCPHRGARLSDGTMREGALECPYHGWRWGGDGVCVLVPSQPGAHPTATLESFPAVERYGLVWTCIGEPMTEPPSITEADVDEQWEFATGAWFDVACGLRSITENFCDSSHFAFVHRETFGDVDPRVPAYAVERGGWSLAWTIRLTFGDQWAADGETRRRGSKYRFGETDGQDRDAEEMVLNYRFEVPSFAYVFTEHPERGRRLVAQAAAPVEAGSSRCRVFWFVAANAPFRRRFGGLQTQVDIEAKVFAEDVPIVEALEPTEAPLDLDGQAHVRADRYSIAYRRLYAELIEQARRLTPAETRG